MCLEVERDLRRRRQKNKNEKGFLGRLKGKDGEPDRNAAAAAAAAVALRDEDKKGRRRGEYEKRK